MTPVRCAIYTRKSSEEGLEQAFNSLDAQREACAAYILSQASEGWTALPDSYVPGAVEPAAQHDEPLGQALEATGEAVVLSANFGPAALHADEDW